MTIILEKDNILVEPIKNKNSHEVLELDENVVSRQVHTRINNGIVVSVSPNVKSDVKIGDIVGYSTYDGVDIKHNKKHYIILSERETQAIILCDPQLVLFKDHSRDDVMEHVHAFEAGTRELAIT